MRLSEAADLIRATPGATLRRCVYGNHWRDVLDIDGERIRLPRDAIHRLEMALIIREAGGSCVWTRHWIAV